MQQSTITLIQITWYWLFNLTL